MARTLVVALIGFALLAAPSRGQDATKLPTGSAPMSFAVAGVDRTAGTYTVNHILPEFKPFQTQTTVIVGGKEQKVTVTSYKVSHKSTTGSYPLKGLEFYNVKGEKLKDDEATKRFVTGAVVLLSIDGNKVDPVYLRIVKEDTLILVRDNTVVEK